MYARLLVEPDGRITAMSSLTLSRQLRKSFVLRRRISVNGALRGSMGVLLKRLNRSGLPRGLLCDPAVSAFQPGTTIGAYRLDHRLGAGGTLWT